MMTAFFLNAEPPIHESYRISPHTANNPERKANVNSVVDDVVALILKQGFAGAIIICLFGWTYRTDKINRATQKENFDKFVAISGECSGHMASVSARLENIEREIESTKQLELLQASRKG